MMSNELYYGDNLDILRRCVLDESVDLIYLDPPFNSQRAYNIIFQDKTGRDSSAQIEAFGDTWSWGEEAQSAYDELMQSSLVPTGLKETMRAFKSFLDQTDLMAYLTMMAIRLVELHRTLKPTGSLYLHCDPTASHYLKIVLDNVFGKKLYRNEIIWRRTTPSSSKIRATRFGSDHDVIHFYSKSETPFFRPVFRQYTAEYIRKRFTGTDERGRFKDAQLKTYSEETIRQLESEGRIIVTPGGKRRYKMYLDEGRGVPSDDVWIDIPPVNSMAKERQGYPTQKPVALLERIIAASSNPGDVVMDPFCGCGTAVVAAEQLGRRWIGIDITYIAVSLIKKRLNEQFPDVQFVEHGIPRSIADARVLFGQSPIEFQKWAVSILGGQPHQRKGGGDKGIDGLLFFQDYERSYHKVIIEVKGGGYQPKDIRALKAVMDREGSPLGVLVALEPPTKGMVTEAAALGKWKLPGGQADYPVLQIFTVAEYFQGLQPRLPDTSGTLKGAPRTLAAREKTSKLEGF